MAKKIGIALGCGGARGLAHLGVLKILKQENIKIDFIVGASMGAFIGALFALDYDLDEIEKEALSFNKKKAIKILLSVSNPKISMIGNKKVKKYAQSFLKNKTFEDTKIPLYVTATDLASGDQVIISKGKIIDAVMASISVPGIFPPVKIGGKYYIDGGVTNPTPIDVVKKLGADVVIGVDLVMQRTIKLANPSIFTTLMQSYEIIRTQGVKYNIKKVESDAILIKPKLRGPIDSFKFYNIGKFIKAGEDAAKKVLPEIKRAIKNKL